MNYLSPTSILQTYNDHKDVINAHLAGTADPVQVARVQQFLGMGIALFVAIAIAALLLWGGAIYVLYSNWATLPDWARVVGVLGVLPLPVPIGPIGTIIVVLITKGSRKEN
jgi:hypothetical protein